MTAERFRVLVSAVLLIGVVTSASLLVIALVSAAAVGWDGSLTGAAVVSSRSTDYGAMIDGLGTLRPIAIAQLGLLVLIATPVVRVATSVLAFAAEKDHLYTVITLTVLGILLLSLFAIR